MRKREMKEQRCLVETSVICDDCGKECNLANTEILLKHSFSEESVHYKDVCFDCYEKKYKQKLIDQQTKDLKTQALAYQPGRCVDDLKIKDVIDLLEHHGTDNIPVGKSEALKKIDASLKSFAQDVAKSKANILLKNI